MIEGSRKKENNIMISKIENFLYKAFWIIEIIWCGIFVILGFSDMVFETTILIQIFVDVFVVLCGVAVGIIILPLFENSRK